MHADEKLLKQWRDLAPGEYEEGQALLPALHIAIQKRGWILKIEPTIIEGLNALKASVSHGVPIISMLGETDAVLAAYVDALDAERWALNDF